MSGVCETGVCWGSLRISPNLVAFHGDFHPMVDRSSEKNMTKKIMQGMLLGKKSPKKQMSTAFFGWFGWGDINHLNGWFRVILYFFDALGWFWGKYHHNQIKLLLDRFGMIFLNPPQHGTYTKPCQMKVSTLGTKKNMVPEAHTSEVKNHKKK